MTVHQLLLKRDAPSFPRLLLLLTLSSSLRPAACFLSGSPGKIQQQTLYSPIFPASEVTIGNLPSSQRQHPLYPASSSVVLSASTSTTTSESTVGEDVDAALLQAKLHVLEDVVVKLNGTKFQDQEVIVSLQSKLDGLEETLEQQKDEFETTLKTETKQFETKVKSKFESDLTKMESRHADKLQAITDSLREESRVEQGELEQRLREESDMWNAKQESQWQESLEIATAAVQAGETREHGLQARLDDLEGRYQQEAADYKAELDQLRKEWKLENARLETDSTRLQTELSDAKQKRDSETTKLIEQLGDRNRQLELDVATVKEQAQVQRVKLMTQQQAVNDDWEVQREKERKFYTEAMRLLQQENAAMREKQGFWKRLFRFGRRPFKRATEGGRRFGLR